MKVFYLQFSAPSLERLFQTFGQASPMRLLWTFMGFSKAYTVFAGATEALAGFMLLSRYTRTLGRTRYGEAREKPPLYGVYEIENFVRNQDSIPPMATDSTRWRHMLVDYPAFTSVLMMDGRSQRYNSTIDTVAQTFTFTISPDTLPKYILHYKLDEKDMLLSGELEGDTLKIQMKYVPLENFGLLNRGFNWVNEVPYNRYQYPK